MTSNKESTHMRFIIMLLPASFSVSPTWCSLTCTRTRIEHNFPSSWSRYVFKTTGKRYPITVKFCRRHDSSVVETFVKFESDMMRITPNLGALRLRDILLWDVLPLSEQRPGASFTMDIFVTTMPGSFHYQGRSQWHKFTRSDVYSFSR